MKPPAGYAQPRRKAAPKKQVRLNLRRAAPRPNPEDALDNRQRSSFWKWFAFVALFHLALFCVVMWFYRPSQTPPPPQFLSLMPEGDTVKGTPGTQAAPKVGASTPAPAHHHHPPTPKPTPPKPPKPPEPVAPTPAAVKTPPVEPKPVIHDDAAPTVAANKPPKPHKPKIKVSLQLANAPDMPADKPAPKHHKKTVTPPPDDQQDTSNADESSSTGLSKEQIAKRLGEKLQAEGVTNSNLTGASGARNSHANDFSDFYASIHDQVMNKWQNPNLADPQAIDPVVQIHVEKNGRVTPGSIALLKSSGNTAIDDSALAAARSLGYLLQPLPDGCPPDISIVFKLNQ